eukprot:8199553-Pyramimonas_sp.AAC.1
MQLYPARAFQPHTAWVPAMHFYRPGAFQPPTARAPAMHFYRARAFQPRTARVPAMQVDPARALPAAHGAGYNHALLPSASVAHGNFSLANYSTN